MTTNAAFAIAFIHARMISVLDVLEVLYKTSVDAVKIFGVTLAECQRGKAS
jgi:hypothetical protein